MSDSPFSEVKNFRVLCRLFFYRVPILLIAENMLTQFSRKELFAGVLHEGGHLKTVPMIVRFLTDIVTLPMSIVLRILAQLRMKLPWQWKIPVRVCYAIERCLHFVTIFAANHADEYSADARAAELQNTAEHLIGALMCLDNYSQVMCTEDLIVEASFALGRESHQHTHPTKRERILHLLRLRKDSM
jgi:Zn-dependent protease with chaperone function